MAAVHSTAPAHRAAQPPHAEASPRAGTSSCLCSNGQRGSVVYVSPPSSAGWFLPVVIEDDYISYHNRW